MPPSTRFTREQLIDAALRIAREEGLSAVTARAVGARLGASSRVIFSQFRGMEDLHHAVIEAASALYQRYLQEDMSSGRYPPYKASGMGYIRFATEERQLFRMLFMCDRRGKALPQTAPEVEPIISIIRRNTGLSEEQARQLHLEMWLFVHGIATMNATNYTQWEPEFVSAMLTHAYQGILHSLREGGNG